MTLGNIFSLLMVIVFTTGCSTPVLSASCPVAMELLQDTILPAKPTGPATNADLLDYALDLNEQVAADSVRKAELRKQLEKCQ